MELTPSIPLLASGCTASQQQPAAASSSSQPQGSETLARSQLLLQHQTSIGRREKH